MSIHRKVDVSMWGDEKFRALSSQPSGRELWFYLLTGPRTKILPGFIQTGRGGIADDLGWDMGDIDRTLSEMIRSGMAKADFSANLIWLPKALARNKPANPNVAKQWRGAYDLVPECGLKREGLAAIVECLSGMGEAFLKSFIAGPSGRGATGIVLEMPKPLSKPFQQSLPEQLSNTGSRKQEAGSRR